MSNDEFQKALNEFDGASPAQQEKLGSRILNLAARWASQRKTTPRDAIEAAFNSASANQNWPEAERIARQLIAMQDSPIMAYRDWDYLSAVLEFQGRIDEAYEAAMKSAQAARDSDMRPLILNALHTEATWAKRRGENDRALECLQEGMAQAEAGGSMYAHHSAGFLVQQAQLFLQSDALEEAQSCLDSAETILRPYAESGVMTGPLSTLRNWHFTTARLLVKRQDIAGALQANQAALELGRRTATLPQLEPLVQIRILHNTQEKFDQIQAEIDQATQTN